MDKTRKEKIEAAGGELTTVADLLELTAEEIALIELKLALAKKLKETRLSTEKSQTELAQVIGSSQSRVAKMEKADTSVSLDLLITSLLKAGVSLTEVKQAIPD